MSTVFSPASRIIIITAALIIVIAGMKQAAPILVPFLLSVFIAVLCLPPMVALQRRGLGIAASLSIIILAITIVGMALAWLVGSSVESFSSNLPLYQSKISAQWSQLINWLQLTGFNVPTEFASENLDPAAAMQLVGGVLAGFGNVLANSFLIFLTVVFILLEAASFNKKMQNIGSAQNKLTSEFVTRLRQYMSIKTSMSALTGGLVSIVLWLLGVDYPALWGVLAFMFNYVPNIGSIIAAVPAVLLALVQLDAGTAMMVGVAYICINVVVGNIIEPKYMGKGLGLSTLVVFLSLVFWGWILGPVGMLLSVPLTVSVKLALDSSEDTRWLGTVLGHS